MIHQKATAKSSLRDSSIVILTGLSLLVIICVATVFMVLCGSAQPPYWLVPFGGFSIAAIGIGAKMRSRETPVEEIDEVNKHQNLPLDAQEKAHPIKDTVYHLTKKLLASLPKPKQ